MAGNEKAQAKAEQLKGKTEKAAGRAMGNERMQAEGRMKESRGDAREALEKTKDVFRD
ncbi:CsbD family protein [Streptomyces sp. NPDC020801]|uniref:CsbD family protein n=1 Tax=unclassified Streptomyces TaxID=2593676 RepID=UPI0037BB9FFF